MTMKTLLDDAAAHAMEDRASELPLVLARAGQDRDRRRLTRRRSAVAALAAAAVIALIAVLLPGSLPAGQEGMPASEPDPLPAVTGVPARWYYAPPWTPPVTRHPMTAAVMVLSAPLQSGPIWHRHAAPGPVLVSADAKDYATLPDWGAGDGGVTLSRDGRRVAWWSTGSRARPRTVIHQLTLSTGDQVDAVLADVEPRTMRWINDSLYLTGDRLKADSANLRRIESGVTWSVSGSVVTRHQPPPAPSSGVPQVTEDFTAPGPVADASGLRWAAAGQANGSWSLQLTSSQNKIGPILTRAPLMRITSDEPIMMVKVLGWGAAGIVVQVNSTRSPGESIHRSIRIIAPDTGKSTTVSRSYQNSTVIPVAVASDLITSSTPIAAPVPAFDARDRSHLAFLIIYGWSRYGGAIKAALLAVIALIVVLVSYRRGLFRSRDSPPPAPE